jgi:channel protein (hemolysin III family)
MSLLPSLCCSGSSALRFSSRRCSVRDEALDLVALQAVPATERRQLDGEAQPDHVGPETLDQALIYLLIAGSYTPFALLYLRFSWWWLLLAVMWLLALWGFATKMFWHGDQFASLRTYLILGWLPIIPAYKYFEYVPLGALSWVLAGGLYYTVGAVFFFLDYKRYHFHAIWHTFVIAGSACHFFGVLIYVACAPPL